MRGGGVKEEAATAFVINENKFKDLIPVSLLRYSVITAFLIPISLQFSSQHA